MKNIAPQKDTLTPPNSPAPPSKDEELQILKETIAKLGPTSYVGPWLLEQLPEFERDMRSDLPVQVSWASVRANKERIESQAKEDAANIVTFAKQNATQLVAAAKKDVQNLLGDTRIRLRQALDIIGQ